MGRLLFGLVRSTPETRDQAAIEGARRQALAAWEIVEDELKGRRYLGGAALSLAEIVLGTQIYRWFNFPIERPRSAEPARVVRAAARAPGLQDAYRDTDHIIARAEAGGCV